MLTKALDDDFESPRNVVTESNVDYLSYKFDEMDLAASWRVLTKQKLNIVNGIRLENASWRTWAKQRNNLKTVSPDTLNWLKDSDVTWLYGPLQKVIKDIGDTDKYAKPKVSTTEDTYGLMTASKSTKEARILEESPIVNNIAEEKPSTPSSLDSPNSRYKRPTASPVQGQQKPLKSALKKVTMSDLLKRSVSELQINNNLSSNISISEANQQLGAFSPSVIASHRQPKLRFNQYVEQCIALSSNENSGNKKRSSSRVRMAELNDVTTTENDDDDDDTSTSEDNYEPGDESDADSVIMMRSGKNKLRSIKKIEPALLKTNSRSDDQLEDSDDSSDEDMISALSGNNYKKKRPHRRASSASNHNNKNNVDWDMESAESDAFVNHIIHVSKGKQPMINRDPAADRIPTSEYISNEYDMMQQGKSDYDYEFDDDDWDTHSEHVEDDIGFTPSTNIHSDYYIPPVSPAPPVGCQIASKAPINNQPILPPVSPTIEQCTSQTKATEDIQKRYDNNSSNSSSSSLFNSIAHWASSHLWPAENNNQ